GLGACSGGLEELGHGRGHLSRGHARGWAGAAGSCPPHRPGGGLGHGPHADGAVLHEVVVAVVLQTDEPAGELAQVGRRVTGAGGLLPRSVLPLVDDLAVAQDRVLLPDDADLVVVPHALIRDAGLLETDRGEVVDRPGLLRLAAGTVVDLDLVAAHDRDPRLGLVLPALRRLGRRRVREADEHAAVGVRAALGHVP